MAIGNPAIKLLAALPSAWASTAKDVLGVVENRLRQSSYLDLRRVHCDYRDGIVTLTGSVPSYYLWQVAQATVKGLSGVKAIDNCLQVQKPSSIRDQYEQ